MNRVFGDKLTEELNNLKLEDTAKLMLSDLYELRFMAEYIQASIRACKLEQFIRKYKQGELQVTLNCPIEVLEEQLECMIAYLGILQFRDSIEHITENIGKLLEKLGEE